MTCDIPKWRRRSHQERCTDALANLALSRPELRELALLAMAAVGRGGQGDVGQRIRDEILTVQSRNNAKVRPLLRAVHMPGTAG